MQNIIKEADYIILAVEDALRAIQRDIKSAATLVVQPYYGDNGYSAYRAYIKDISIQGAIDNNPRTLALGTGATPREAARNLLAAILNPGEFANVAAEVFDGPPQNAVLVVGDLSESTGRVFSVIPGEQSIPYLSPDMPEERKVHRGGYMRRMLNRVMSFRF